MPIKKKIPIIATLSQLSVTERTTINEKERTNLKPLIVTGDDRKIDISNTDVQLITLLSANARISPNTMVQRLDLTAPTLRKKNKHLEKESIIYKISFRNHKDIPLASSHFSFAIISAYMSCALMRDKKALIVTPISMMSNRLVLRETGYIG